MSETSRSRVTITLGRTGQFDCANMGDCNLVSILGRREKVVKRDGNALDSSRPVLGSKRSVHERLGNNVDSTAEINNKRLRRDGRPSHDVDDNHLTKGDLRHKIMQKNSLKQSRNSVDLRNLLSRPAQSSTNSITTRTHMIPDPNDSRPRYSEPTETRDGRHSLPMTRNSIQHLNQAPDPRKQHALESRESGRSFLQEKDVRYRGPDPRMEPVINSYSPWTLDSVRQRSPEESLATSRGGPVAIAPKRDEILQRRLPVGTYDDARTSAYNISKEDLEISRPMSSSQLTKMPPPIGRMKNIAPVTSQLPLPGNLMQNSSYMVDDQVSVDSFLRSLGLEKYAILFKAEEVDMYSLKRMTEGDLKELGIPMGPRKKILLSLQPRLKQQA